MGIERGKSFHRGRLQRKCQKTIRGRDHGLGYYASLPTKPQGDSGSMPELDSVRCIRKVTLLCDLPHTATMSLMSMIRELRGVERTRAVTHRVMA